MDLDVRLPSGRRLSSLKVKDLQRELNRRRLSCLGRKAELLARLTEHIITECAANTNGDPVSVSPVTTEHKDLSEDGKLIRRTTTKRRSHSRLNETFEYVEEVDGEETTQAVSALTPEDKCVAPLIDASHRKSSRQAKDGHSRGDTEVVRSQTPKSSRKSRPSSGGDQSGFFTDDEAKSQLEPLPIQSDFLSDDECSEKHSEEMASSGKTEVNVNSVKRNIKQERDKGRASLKSSSARSTKTTPKALAVSQAVTQTPKSEGRSRGGFAAPTVASEARSTQKETLFPKAENSVAAVANTNTHQSSNGAKSKRTLLPRPKRDVLQGLPSSSRSIKKRERGNATAQFARQHARLFEEMESIADQKERIARLHEEHMRAAPSVVKRLATPKVVRNPLADANTRKSTGKKTAYIFDASKAKTSVTENSFNFGKADDFRPEQNESKSQTVITSFKLKKPTSRDERDVKSRTKADSKQRKAPGFIGLTLPVNNPSVNLLATPKSMSKPKARERTTYTPHRGAVGTFVDTTKLSDREYELAIANGLIKGKSRSSIRVDNTRKSRRDEILDVKRKLHI